MAKKDSNEVAVGITTLVVLALTIYIVLTLADWSGSFTPQQEITVRLPYKVGLKGLTQGSIIRLGGVKVGYITSTQIKKTDPITTDPNNVYVFFTMKLPQQYCLRSDCVLLPRSNILGSKAELFIEDLGGEGEIITNHQTVDISLADDVMGAIKREFDPGNPDSFFARVIKKDIPAITEQIQETIQRANSALDTAKLAMKNMKELSDDKRIDRIISNITELSVSLKLASQEVRRAPWRLLHKPTEKESRIQAIVDSAGAFAAGAERLDIAASRLQNLAADPEEKLDQDRIERMVLELDASFQQFQKAEQKFWEELR
jgi:uncharacterized protein YoxC